jgi:tetratricopeptide (TPR) repeat protein
LLGLLGSSVAFAQEVAVITNIQTLSREVGQSWFDRAVVAEREGHTLTAESLYIRALEADPGNGLAHLGYARTLDARGHRSDALAALARAPRRAWINHHDAMEFARLLHSLGAVEESLATLREHSDNLDATRMLIDIASREGRFPEALAAARRLNVIAEATDTDTRSSRVLVRALTRLVAEADAVHAPHTTTAFRRALMQD